MHHLSRPSPRLAALLVATLAMLSGVNTLDHAFTWDDAYNVVDNEAIRDLGSIPSFFMEAWGSHAADADTQGMNANYWRPLALTSFAIDHALWGPLPEDTAGPSLAARGFHLTNVLLHAIVSLLVLVLGWRLFGGAGDRMSLGVLAASCVFAVHPVHTEAVNVITYRTDILAGLFLLAGLCVWLGPTGGRGRTRERWCVYLWVPLLYALGLASKEMAVTLPALAFLADRALHRETRRWSGSLARVTPMVAVLVAYLMVRSVLLTPSTHTYFTDAPPDHVALTMLAVFGRYLGLLVWPWPLNPFYDWSVLPVETSLWSWPVLSGALGLLALLLAAGWCWRRRPGIAWALLLFPVVLLPVSHLIPIIVAAAERFLYVAVAGPLLALGVLGARHLRASWFAGVAVGLVCLALATTCARNGDWRTDRAILEANVRDWPESYNGWFGLARLHERQGRSELAVPIYVKLGRADDARRARVAAEPQPTYHPRP